MALNCCLEELDLDITLDLEANSLLNAESIDYTASPYRLKDNFKMHCIVVEDHKTKELFAFYDGPTYIFDGREFEESDEDYTYSLKDYEPIDYTHFQLNEFPQWVQDNPINKVVAHNGINYDFLVFKMYFGMDYEINPDTWAGKSVQFEDTLVIAKTLNPDRFGGASLENLAKMAGKAQKINFRKHIPQAKRFNTFAADMLYYNIFDVKSNTDVYNYLMWEKGDWDWDAAITLEKEVAEIITRQEHRGFLFDKELAEANVKELDNLMEERRQRVEPLLPPRPATKKFLQEHTPPVNQFKTVETKMPKTPFKKDGSFSATLEKFCEKVGGELRLDGPCKGVLILDGEEYEVKSESVIKSEIELSSFMENFVKKHNGDIHPTKTKVRLYGKVYTLPMPLEPIKTEMVATIDDTTHIKNWLVGLGWSPSEYKEKDITVKSGTKIKRTPDEIKAAVDKYVEESLASNFLQDRLEFIEANVRNFKMKLLSKATKRSCKVRTNPSFTVGQEKEMCPNLELLADKFPYAKDIVEYLTYKHRRNSILGGNLDWEDGEEAEKGYLAYVREDRRIPTPADTCGCATSRMKHKMVANIPRVSSLYGDKMRALFGVDKKSSLQVGYDFSSLEARIEGHYCWPFEKEEGKPYCTSLLLEKPNDVHTRTAEKISSILQKPFERASAKSCKYGITYGSQPAKVAKIIGGSLEDGELVFEAFWEAANPLKQLKEALTVHWKEEGNKKFIRGLDGRKIPTRAEHAILNSLFQSAGVICAKKTMALHDKMMKAEGLSVDFFKDDWKNSRFCQQLIAYHDEAQLEESKENFRFKQFESKEEALEWTKEQNKEWSEPFQLKEKWYVGYSRASELISKAVEETTNHFKLNVPLHAGYIIGVNWADCH